MFAYSGLAIGQINLSTFDKTSFLIGTLSDYIGHEQTFTVSTGNNYFQLVDSYHKEETKLVALIDSLFKSEYKDLRTTNNGAPNGIRIFSKSLSTVINDYFKYEPSFMGRTVEGDTIYMGSLKSEKLITDLQKLSFIAGVYLRFGGKTEANEYYFSMPNSLSKSKICAELLIKFKCTDVKYITKKERFPVANFILFEPSKRIEEFIKIVEPYMIDRHISSEILKIMIEKL